MLKKLLLALICLPVAFAGFSAQLTATLQSGDKVTPFYGANSFVDAYNAAIDGDVITLSPGLFTDTEIQKSITVTGTYAFSTDDSKTTRFSSLTVSADNVTIEGLRFTGTLLIKGADQLSIVRCQIYQLDNIDKEGHKYHNNTIVTDCMVTIFNAMSLSKNAVLRNCCIDYFYNRNEVSNPALVENCNISDFIDTRFNNVLCQPYAIYRNCVLGLFSDFWSFTSPKLNIETPSEFHNNCFLGSYKYEYNSNYTNDWVIDYGSCVHYGNVYVTAFYSCGVLVPRVGSFLQYKHGNISYGPADHKEYPAIPSITYSEIDTKTDAEGNLHVKISATARD